MILLVIFSQMRDSNLKKCHVSYKPDKLVAYFSIGHVILWVRITVLDRVIQWRYQIIRTRGYRMFYRKMRNICQVPFVMVSTSE